MKKNRRRNHRIKLFEVQGGVCPYCRKGLPAPDATVPRHQRATIEHVVPRSLGGSNALTNKLLVHAICNERRGVRPLWRRERKAHREVLARLLAVLGLEEAA